MGIRSGQKCQYCQFCAFGKNANRKQSESSNKEKRLLSCMERDVTHMFMSGCRVIENDFSVCAVDCLVMSIEVFDRYTQLKSKAPILCTQRDDFSVSAAVRTCRAPPAGDVSRSHLSNCSPGFVKEVCDLLFLEG